MLLSVDPNHGRGVMGAAATEEAVRFLNALEDNLTDSSNLGFI